MITTTTTTTTNASWVVVRSGGSHRVAWHHLAVVAIINRGGLMERVVHLA
jgi:hypothetical protein